MKGETEKSASAAKKDVDNPLPSKAPVSLNYRDTIKMRTIWLELGLRFDLLRAFTKIRTTKAISSFSSYWLSSYLS